MPAGKFLLDTNIPIYTFDDKAPVKRARAKALVEEALQTKNGCISMQVVQEALSLLTSKYKHAVSSANLQHYLENVLERLAQPVPMLPLYHDALRIQERWKFGFYDALIVAAALALECDVIYSEDFHHGQRIESLTVINPFVETA